MTAVTYDDALSALEARLGHKAAKHCKRVAATAAELAAAYGVDVESARLAGLLHDWDRETPPETLLAAAARDGVEVSDADAANPHLLHARTGAVAVREAFPDLPAEVTQPELFTLGYQRSVRYLVDARKRIHPDTVAVWNALVAGDRS